MIIQSAILILTLFYFVANGVTRAIVKVHFSVSASSSFFRDKNYYKKGRDGRKINVRNDRTELPSYYKRNPVFWDWYHRVFDLKHLELYPFSKVFDFIGAWGVYKNMQSLMVAYLVVNYTDVLPWYYFIFYWFFGSILEAVIYANHIIKK